jgi:hypothetical protein
MASIRELLSRLNEEEDLSVRKANQEEKAGRFFYLPDFAILPLQQREELGKKIESVMPRRRKRRRSQRDPSLYQALLYYPRYVCLLVCAIHTVFNVMIDTFEYPDHTVGASTISLSDWMQI